MRSLAVPSALISLWITTNFHHFHTATNGVLFKTLNGAILNNISSKLCSPLLPVWTLTLNRNVSGCQSIFAKMILRGEVLPNAVHHESPPALLHCALILNIDEWKILKILRIPAANFLLPHFRAIFYTNPVTLSKSFSLQWRLNLLQCQLDVIITRNYRIIFRWKLKHMF